MYLDKKQLKNVGQIDPCYPALNLLLLLHVDDAFIDVVVDVVADVVVVADVFVIDVVVDKVAFCNVFQKRKNLSQIFI